MQIFDFIKPLLKWWWMILLSTAIAAVVSYFITKPLPPVYLAHTTLMVGRAISDPNPSGNEFGMAQQLAIYYTSIAMREPIYEATKFALGLEELPKYSAQTVPASPFIEISVTDTDPIRAMIVANELANQLILQSPTAPQKEEIERQRFIEGQLNQIQLGIVETQKSIEEKQLALANLTSATEIQDVQAEIAALESKRSILQNNYADLVSSSSGAINTITAIEVASVPIIPIGPKKYLIIGLAALAGLILAAGIAYLIEFFDRTVRTPEDVERFYKTSVLGYIQRFNKSGKQESSVISDVRSPAAEAFRTLRTNIGFASVGEPFRKLVITSAHQGEGKTTIAINLAISMANAGRKVCLLDADLRRPQIHRMVDIPIEPGLSNAFQEQVPFTVLSSQSNLNPNLKILPAGKPPPNPTELINSSKMDQILGDLVDGEDFLLIDTPPIIVPDASLLASKVDGVLLVIQPGRVRYETAEKVAQQIRRSGGRLIGVVFNQLNPSDVTPYSSYHYYHYKEEQKKKTNPILEGLRNVFFDDDRDNGSKSVKPNPSKIKKTH